MIVRSHLTYLKEWINDRLADLSSGKTPNPEKTFAHYWIKNAGNGENFAQQDVVDLLLVAECERTQFQRQCEGEQVVVAGE